MYLIICTTDGCSQNGIEKLAKFPDGYDGPKTFCCGVCGELITDANPVDDDYELPDDSDTQPAESPAAQDGATS